MSNPLNCKVKHKVVFDVGVMGIELLNIDFMPNSCEIFVFQTGT
jgi:hypothetical protein